MDNLDLYIRDIAASLKTIAGGGAAADLSSVATKLDTVATKLDSVVAKLDAIDGHLNPLYNADYVAPGSGE